MCPGYFARIEAPDNCVHGRQRLAGGRSQASALTAVEEWKSIGSWSILSIVTAAVTLSSVHATLRRRRRLWSAT